MGGGQGEKRYIYPVAVEGHYLSMLDGNDLGIEKCLLPLHVETEDMIRSFILYISVNLSCSDICRGAKSH